MVRWIAIAGLMLGLCTAGLNAEGLDIKAVAHVDGTSVEIVEDGDTVFSPTEANSALSIVQPQGRTAVRYSHMDKQTDLLRLAGGVAPGLELSETWKRITPSLWERTVLIKAVADGRYYLDMAWKTSSEGDYYSYLRKEPKTATYSPSCTGPGFSDNSWQTFPLVGVRHGDRFYGLIGDSPGLWNNRSFLHLDYEKHQVSVATGDGSAKQIRMIPWEVDATNIYRTEFDGWQHIESGEEQSFTSWVFSSPVGSLYDVQVAATLALANGKGWNSGSVEAILRNTSYLLLRRNYMRTESDYIFISGVGYGWKQWVSDGFWMSRGLDDPKYDAEANMAVFYERVNYEENAQYFLIWSYLVKQAGGTPDPRTVARAYRFIRQHEKDGLYIPPRLKPELACFKTYHDQLPYDDDDAPSSNQGFHCGALMAARELGFDVTDAEIEKAIAGYRRMFNEKGGYFATSLKQQENIGQDSLYGEVLTYAVFGRKLLPDDMVRRHLETTMRIQSPYGMRVISKANGDLLEGHSGVYVYGGSWFLNDAANYLDGLIHGMDPKWVDDKLLWRLEKELAWMPAFHESISTVTGKPHGHHLYSWNSGYWWLRREIRKNLGLKGPDPLDARVDDLLNVKRQDGYLSLRAPSGSEASRSDMAVPEVFEEADKPEFTRDAAGDFYLCKPWNYEKPGNAGRKYPLLVYLHGGGGSGVPHPCPV